MRFAANHENIDDFAAQNAVHFIMVLGKWRYISVYRWTYAVDNGLFRLIHYFIIHTQTKKALCRLDSIASCSHCRISNGSMLKFNVHFVRSFHWLNLITYFMMLVCRFAPQIKHLMIRSCKVRHRNIIHSTEFASSNPSHILLQPPYQMANHWDDK